MKGVRSMSHRSKEHLPIYGVGPIYVYTIAILTVAAFFCRKLQIFGGGNITASKIPLVVIGSVMIIIGIYMWIQAVIISKVGKGIEENRLITTGVYAWVRNPIYSAVMILCTGIIIMIGNVYFLILPFVYWLFMTILMKNTEEKWLTSLYGKEYEEYCKRVNRCIPWIPSNKNRR